MPRPGLMGSLLAAPPEVESRWLNATAAGAASCQMKLRRVDSTISQVRRPASQPALQRRVGLDPLRPAPRTSATSGIRASSGPAMIVISTYAVASAASESSTPAPTASPAMTIENSPARGQGEAGAPPARLADPGRAGREVAGEHLRRHRDDREDDGGDRASARGRAGSVDSPKKRKKTDANRSRSGVSRRCACAATGPEIAMPTRKAPTAAETLDLRGERRHHEGEAQHREQQHLGVARPHQPRDEMRRAAARRRG